MGAGGGSRRRGWEQGGRGCEQKGVGAGGRGGGAEVAGEAETSAHNNMVASKQGAQYL